MAENSKPRKKHALQTSQNSSGKGWVELNELHYACTSHIQSTTGIGPILKQVAPFAVEPARMAELAKSLAQNLVPRFVTELNNIRTFVNSMKAEWDNVDSKRKEYWKNNDRPNATACVDRMNEIEFSSIQAGENYQRWMTDWTVAVTPKVVELMTLLEQSRLAMESKLNANDAR